MKMKDMGCGVFRITPEQCKDILDNGFTIVETRPGSFIRITMDDILINKDDAYKLLKETRNKNDSR